MTRKIPIQIDPLFWVLAFGLGWLYSAGNIPLALIAGCVILFSILFHEFGHALTALAFGQQVSITLMMLGGITRRQGPTLKKWQDFLIVLNGPLAGFLLGFVALSLSKFFLPEQNPYAYFGLKVAMYVNFFWTALNLIPIQPLDGGHLLSIMLQGIFGYRGIKISYFISFVLAGALAALGFVFHEIFIGALFSLFAFESFRGWRGSLSMTKEDQDESLQNLLKSATEAYTVHDNEEAKNDLQFILKNSTSRGVIFQKASELLATIFDQEDRFEEAYTLLNPQKKNLDLEGLILLQSLAFKSGRYKESVLLGTTIHQDVASPEIALLNALSHAQLNEVQPAVGWLKTAITEGLENPSLKLRDARFDPIRSSPSFQALYLSLPK